MTYRVTIISLLVASLWVVIIGAALWSPLMVHWLLPRTTITLFIPPLVIDPKTIKDFEQETGIKVQIAYYENATALLNKMNSTKGRGYDVIFSDDHSSERLIKAGLLSKIDKKRLPFFKNIDAVMARNYYDPALRYTIPYFSLMYGIAYNAAELTKLGVKMPTSWSFIFDPPESVYYRLGMTDDPREAFLLATYYKYHDIFALTDLKVQEEMVELLRNQKQYVDAYSLERADHLMQTKNCLAATMVSGDYWRVHKKSPEIDFVVPDPGIFVGFYSFALVNQSEKKELAYQLLRYLFRPAVMLHQGQKFGFMPSISSVMKGHEIPPSIHDYKDRPMIFFRNVVSDREFNDLWIQVLS
jgi:spermidine/putrescine transport system substrate-binding protein